MIRTVKEIVSEIETDLRAEEGAWLVDELRGMVRGLDEVRQRFGESTPVLEAGRRPIAIPIPRTELRRVAARAYLGIDADAPAAESVIDELLREDHEIDVIVDAILGLLGLELIGRVKDLHANPLCPYCHVEMRRRHEEEEPGDLGLGSMRPARIVWICGCVPEGEEGAEDERRRSESRETVAPS